ncbi:MAG: 3-phosphoshikimate 1-carboxyvinyltransferase, partial [Candidatus Omnitrophota bacterium]
GIDAIVHGVGMQGLKRPKHSLYLGNSGTTMRVLPGILSGQDFRVVLKGDRSLSKRPMQRIVGPLRKMGLRIKGKGKKQIYPPLEIHGGNLKPIRYRSRVASAQVKSCILLAGLFAEGSTGVTEPVKSRDHTERILKIFGCRLKVKGCTVSLKGPAKLKSPRVIKMPADISSAAFFMVAGCILPRTKIIIKDVGLNPTRTGIVDILRRMGGDIRIKNKRLKGKDCEPMGDIIVASSRLKGIKISPLEVIRVIDEVPIIMVAAASAKGPSVIKGVGELRIKETDRIKSMVTNLRKMGGEIDVRGDVLRIRGGSNLHGTRVSSYGDHRTAMSMLIAGLVSKGRVSVTGLDCINKSFPGFLENFTLLSLTKT